MYSKRKDHFISKEQALEIIRAKEEAALRIQRIQELREEAEKENKQREQQKNPGDDWDPSFNPEDHVRIKSMKPMIRNMVSIIKD